MLKPKKIWETTFRVNETYRAEPLIKKLQRKMSGELVEGTEIDETIPTLYTDKRDGCLPGTDIRTDRFEVAREAIDKVNKARMSEIAKAEEDKKEELEERTSDAES
ncbi:hypothetical protein [Sigmofec virus UA08Rod_5365]|uniref:Uncharacterized protein n=1 Tax=Sigmofec virus UA08Rod_5365 TaxID=2929422 RepID=A0A976R8K9_9VIRU|nr:hypothetical protein [Sigmofec virus UA08Rod_5365]